MDTPQVVMGVLEPSATQYRTEGLNAKSVNHLVTEIPPPSFKV